jgi:hypothetical protein
MQTINIIEINYFQQRCAVVGNALNLFNMYFIENQQRRQITFNGNVN